MNLMNLIGRYGSSGIDLEGAAEDLRHLSRTIQEFVGSETFFLVVPSVPSSPYEGYLKSLRLEQHPGKVCISRDAGAIVISGPPDKLLVLARNIEEAAEGQDPPNSGKLRYHSHIEYYPEHFYLSEESEPLVVTKAKTTRS
jgi:hypothetical protein